MKFLVDECTSPTVAQWLIENGHDFLQTYSSVISESDFIAVTEDTVRLTTRTVEQHRDGSKKSFGAYLF